MRVILLLPLLLALYVPVRAQTFQGLGDLPGGSLASVAEGVSGDGSTVVGFSGGEKGTEAFRWTQATGMVGLGDLSGFTFISQGYGTSFDGSVVVGYASGENGGEAFRWTEATGMVGLGDLGEVGEDVFRSEAYGVSGDGAVVVGVGRAEWPEPFRWTAAEGMQSLGVLPESYTGEANAVSADGTTLVGISRSVTAAGNQAFRWTQDTGLVGLGDLPGGSVFSDPYDVSADGSVVVGIGRTEVRSEAFRWTRDTGMVGLGVLPGGESSLASAVTADGTVIVGWGGGSGVPSEAWIWTAEEGMRALKSVLEEDYGLDLTGWELQRAKDISADGTVIVGDGTNPEGHPEAWRAVLPLPLTIESPPADSLFLPYGDPYTVRWEASDAVGGVDVLLLPDTLGSPALELDFGLDGQSYAWTIPDTLFSRSARLVVRGFTDASVADTSAFFRIKPYHLTRLADGGAYERFTPSQHGWRFGNTEANLFPSSWWAQEQFDYADGTDPFSSLAYDDEVVEPPANGEPEFFPDWPAFARAFGIDDTYWFLVPFVNAAYEQAALARWGAGHGSDRWGGSCFGLAVGSLLAFSHQEAFGAAYPDIGPVDDLATVDTSAAAREAINALYVYQYGRVARTYRSNVGWTTRTPSQTLNDLRDRLGDDDPGNDGNLSIYNVQSCSPFNINGGHAVTPYRLQRVSEAPERWRVYVYDSNRPGDANRFIDVNVTANTWSYAGFSPAWGGACGMYLRDPITNYLGEAEPTFLAPVDPRSWREAGSGEGTRRGSDTALEVAATAGASVRITAADGASVGYAGGAVFNEIEDAIPDVPEVGGLAAPTSYHVPRGAYALTLAEATDGLLSATVFGARRIVSYGRADAEAPHTDHLAFDPEENEGTLTLRSADAGVSKRVTLRAIATEDPERERTLAVRDLVLTGTDSVRFATPEAPDGPRLVLANLGSTKTYTVRLRTASADGATRFAHAGVMLEAGAIHTVRPDWGTLAMATLEIDRDGDGVPEETVPLANEVAAEGGAPEALPTDVMLAGVYPNPTRGPATVRYGLPETGAVRLVVVNLLGRRVTVLADEAQPAGWHEVTLDGSRLSSGAYVVRLTTAGGVHTQRLTVVR